MPFCLVGLGSNLGNHREILDAAAVRLAEHPRIRLLARSRWRETTPVGGPAGQPNFLNGAVRLETSLLPGELLAFLQEVENRAGRRRTERWGPRTLDLDLLLYGELMLDTPELTIPHPRMAWRRFVLEPAADVAGDMTHPVIGWSVLQLLEHLKTSRPYVAVTGPIAVGKTRLARRLADALDARLVVETPDWTQLDAFYADPAAHAWPVETDFLQQRAKLLAADAPAWSGPRWTVSDFWFDQSAAFARAWLPAGQQEEYDRQYEQSRQKIMRPKLIVLLDAPADVLLSRVRRRGRGCERPITEESLERIRQEIYKQVSLPDLGPVLRIDSDDSETVFSEVLAALRGME